MVGAGDAVDALRRAADRGFHCIAPAENREEASTRRGSRKWARKIQRLFDAYGDQGLMNVDLAAMAVDCALVPTLTDDVDEVIAVLGPKEELDFEDFCRPRVGLALEGSGRARSVSRCSSSSRAATPSPRTPLTSCGTSPRRRRWRAARRSRRRLD